MIDINELVSRLRSSGTDDTSLEVKSAAGGLPASMDTTLCALANLPGGGTVIAANLDADGALRHRRQHLVDGDERGDAVGKA